MTGSRSNPGNYVFGKSASGTKADLRQIPGTDYPIGKIFANLPMSETSPYRCGWWYRKEFAATKFVKRATIYATSLGIYELYLNGSRVGNARFAPGWTDYPKSAYYCTYDVTSLVKRGGNAIGAWVADGWYSGYIGFGLLAGLGTERTGRDTYGKTPALMLQLEIEYTDNSREIIPTDKSWRETGGGPIFEADFLMGEAYDARNVSLIDIIIAGSSV